MKLIARKSGEAVEVPDADVQKAFQSGQFGLPAGAQLPMVGDDGIGYVDAKDAATAFTQGQRLAAPDEVAKARAEAQYGGVGGGLKAGAAAVARGATFGLSDVAAPAIAYGVAGREGAEATRAELAGLKAENPTISTAGEIAGAVAPLLVSGGGAAAAEGAAAGGALARVGEAGSAAMRAAGAIPRGVAALGDLAGGAVARGLGEGAISRIASTAVSGAVQGGIAGFGSELSDAALGNTELTGEKLLAAVGHGALLGGAVGGGLQATGELGSYVLGRLHPHLTGLAEEQAFRAINARKAFTTEANKMPGGVRGIGRTLLDDGIVAAGDTVESVAPKIAAAREGAGEKVGAVLDAADKAGIEGPQMGRILDRAEKEVAADLRKLGMTNKGALSAVKDVMQDLTTYAADARGMVMPTAGTAGAEALQQTIAGVRDLRLTFRETQAFRTRLDDVIKWNTNPLGPINEKTEAMKKIRGILESELTDAGEVAAKKMGGSFKAEYEAAKLKYRQLTIADKAARDAVERAQANAAHSLTDKIVGAHGLSAGLMHGFASEHGGFALGGIQGLAVGAVAGKLSKLVRTQGNSTAAVMLDKMAAIGGIRRAQASVDRQITRGVAGLFSENERAALRPKEHPLGDYDGAVEAVSAAVGQSGRHAAMVNGAVAPIAPHAPQVTNAFERAALRATTFLASKIPPTHRPAGSLTPQFDKPRVTDTDKERFLRYVQAVHDPTTVLHKMRQGSITAEEVEALRAVYPEMYGEIRQQIAARLQDAKHPLPYAEETRVKRLFGFPAMDPTTVAILQGNFATPMPGGKGHPAAMPHQPPARPLKDAEKFTRLAGLQPGT